MEIIPVAFDSLGTRSMCTFIKSDDINILIDPAVALGPRRYGLPPHKKELERKEEHWKKIKEYAKKADLIIITHYHYDHHNPNYPELFKDKILFIKHPEKNINRSQYVRAKRFLERIEGYPKEIRIAEGVEEKFGKLRLKISQSVWHGNDKRLGFVVEIFIEEDKRFLFTSDVEGPVTDEQTLFILENDPDIIFSDGPMTYQPQVYDEETLKKAIENIKKIIEKTGVKKYILDHHLVRDLEFSRKIKEIFEVAEQNGCEIMTAAKFGGFEEDFLEAHRKDLWKGEK